VTRVRTRCSENSQQCSERGWASSLPDYLSSFGLELSKPMAKPIIKPVQSPAALLLSIVNGGTLHFRTGTYYLAFATIITINTGSGV
jgi:hypothetical protein